jgi:hypothetical protein
MVAQESDLNDRHPFRCGVTIAAALFALSGWLLDSSHRWRREAH